MKIHRLQKATNQDVRNWIYEMVPDLTEYQKSEIRRYDLRFCLGLEFFKPRKRVNNIWWRLSGIAFPFVWLIMFIGLPVNFLFTGYWGYSKIEWFDQWRNNLNI
jgi:hypothetical protein